MNSRLITKMYLRYIGEGLIIAIIAILGTVGVFLGVEWLIDHGILPTLGNAIMWYIGK